MASKSGPGKNTKLSYFVIAVAMLLFVVSILGGAHGGLLSGKAPARTGSTALVNASSDYDVTLNNTTIYHTDPITQLQRVSLIIAIKNNSSDTLQISPGLQMQLIDDIGQSHAVTAQYYPVGEVIGGPLNPGEKWIKTIDFNLSVGRNPVMFVYQVDAKSKPVEIDI